MILRYDGTFPLSWLHDGESVRAIDGDASIAIRTNSGDVIAKIGQVLIRHVDGSISVR